MLCEPAHYDRQLAQKASRIEQQFASLSAPPLAVYRSRPEHYRMRAEFKFWHQGDDSYFVMFDPQQPRVPIRVDQFPVASERINELMASLAIAVRSDQRLRHKLFQVEFLTTLSDDALVTLIYHRKLEQDWEQAARALEQQLQCAIIGRSKKQKWVLSRDYVNETLNVGGRPYYYQQIEGSFTQPNAGVNEQMLGWALQQSQALGGDLLELYCGNGNFSCVLAAAFRQVLATEISKSSVRSAEENFRRNRIDNAKVVRMSSEDITSALRGERPFRRLRDIALDQYAFTTVFVDPPRAGLDPATETLVAGFENILYISCNPDTLHHNLQRLCQSHAITAFALFDQFPYTHHVECGVLLQRR